MAKLDERAIARLGDGKEPRIGVFDIETAPSRGEYFDRYKQYNITRTIQDWFMFCFSYRWLGEKKIHTFSLHDFGYNPEKPDDWPLIEKLWYFFNEADILVGHNIDAFDVKKANTRFLVHGLHRPSPYDTFDTKKVAKSVAGFESNRLDDLARQMGVERKLQTGGQHLWELCRDTNEDAPWRLMERYNAQDVVVAEQVYLKLRGWAKNHPNLTHMTRNEHCPVCMGYDLKRDGYRFRAGMKYQRFACNGCGKYFVSEEPIPLSKVYTRQ